MKRWLCGLAALWALLCCGCAAPALPAGEESPPPKLITQEHIAYLAPLAEGIFAPEQPISRGQVCQSLSLLLAEPAEGNCSFSDLSPGDGVYEAAARLCAAGVLADSTEAFRPDELIRGTELLSLLSVFYPPEEMLPGEGPFFPDFSDHPASAALENAADRKWVSPDSFLPEETVSRGAFCRILNRALGRSCDIGLCRLSGQAPVFEDLSPNHIYYADIMEVLMPHEHVMDYGYERWTGISLEPGFHRCGGRLYYVQENGELLRRAQYKVWTFNSSGAYTTCIPELDNIIASLLNSFGGDNASAEQALRSAYLFTTENKEYRLYADETYGFDDMHDEHSLRALTFFRTDAGLCYDYAAAFGLMARALGYEAYIVKAHFDHNHVLHGWVVIPEGRIDYIYDPETEAIHNHIYDDFDLFRCENGLHYQYWYTPWW